LLRVDPEGTFVPALKSWVFMQSNDQSLFRFPFFNPFMKPETKSQITMMTMPIAKKLGTPVFLKKSWKYSTVSIL
jgi:hypothetical protein